MKHDTGIFEAPDIDADATADARALSDIEAGRTISHEAMRDWLLAWGRGERNPMPNVGD